MNTARAGTLAGVTVAAGAAVLAGPLVLSVPGGLLLAFVLPGTALTGAMFRPGRRDIGVVERLVLVPALSLAVLVLGGLGLWAIGGSLNQAGWLSLAVAVTLIAIGVSVARSRFGAPVPGPAGAAPVPSPPVTRPVTAVRIRAFFRPAPGVLQRRLLRDVLPLTLAVALLTGIGWWSFADSKRTYDVTVTTLSAAPPGPVDDDGNRQVQVSAAGLAPTAGPYRLMVSGAEGEAVTEQNLTPGTGGDWTGRFEVPGEERVTIELFRAGDTAALRTVIIAAAP